MPTLEFLRKIVSERMAAAAEEVFQIFEQTVSEYEKEIERQRALLHVVWQPHVKLYRTERVCEEKDAPTEPDQEDPKPLPIKEEREDLCVHLEGEYLGAKQNAATFSSIPTQGNIEDLPQSKSKEDPSDTTTQPPPECGGEPYNYAVSVRRKESSSTHEGAHTDQRQYCCGTCGEKFVQRPLLICHMQTHSCHSGLIQDPGRGETSYSCSTCGKTFGYRSLLKRHCQTHTGEKPYSCITCGKTFAYCSLLNRHRQTHTGEKPYSCTTCGKTFGYRFVLKRHRRTHTGDKPFSCSTCGKRFPDQSHLTVHKRIHTGEKPYSCSTCGKRFTDKSQVNVHKRSHTGEEPYSCSTCGKTFKWYSGLLRHHKTHTESNVYEEESLLIGQSLCHQETIPSLDQEHRTSTD